MSNLNADELGRIVFANAVSSYLQPSGSSSQDQRQSQRNAGEGEGEGNATGQRITALKANNLTAFRDHCQAKKPDIKTIAEAARCAKEFQTIFPFSSRCYHLILTAASRRHQVNAVSQS